jgi:hypothetical protein
MSKMSNGTKKPEEEKLDRDEWTEADRQAEHKIRMRFEFRDLVEDLILDGQERGVFDNLQGKGKPLNLKSNLDEGESALANELMKEHEIVPEWLMRRNTVYVAIEELRHKIGRHWMRHEQAYRMAQDRNRRMALALNWRAMCREFQAEIVEINKLIDDFNLRRPSEGMEIFKVRLDDELKRVGASRELK